MSPPVRALRMMMLVAAMLLGTYALGWWGVLFVAIAFAIIDRAWSVAAEAGLAAGLAWFTLFLVNAVLRGPELIALVANAMSLRPPLLPALTVVFPAMLAWSGAMVTMALCQLFGWRRLDAARRVQADPHAA